MTRSVTDQGKEHFPNYSFNTYNFYASIVCIKISFVDIVAKQHDANGGHFVSIFFNHCPLKIDDLIGMFSQKVLI